VGPNRQVRVCEATQQKCLKPKSESCLIQSGQNRSERLDLFAVLLQNCMVQLPVGPANGDKAAPRIECS
jgi:hypothetical protein